MIIARDTEAEIRRLYFVEHWKRGTIAAQLRVHPDVVVRTLGTFGPKPGSPRPDARVLEPYHAFIAETLERYPRLVATRLYDMLRERGYTGSVRTLRRYVLTARPRSKVEAVLRVETLPGEQAQVDWAHVGEIAVDGGRRPLWAFVIVLAHSRASFAELVVSLDVHSLRRSLVRAAVAFGGLPRQWLFDNAKTVVTERRALSPAPARSRRQAPRPAAALRALPSAGKGRRRARYSLLQGPLLRRAHLPLPRPRKRPARALHRDRRARAAASPMA